MRLMHIITAKDWKQRLVWYNNEQTSSTASYTIHTLKSWAISWTDHWKGSLRMSNLVNFWYCLISRRGMILGLKRWRMMHNHSHWSHAMSHINPISLNSNYSFFPQRPLSPPTSPTWSLLTLTLLTLQTLTSYVSVASLMLLPLISGCVIWHFQLDWEGYRWAVCKTVVPDTFYVLLFQRSCRRATNTAYTHALNPIAHKEGESFAACTPPTLKRLDLFFLYLAQP